MVLHRPDIWELPPQPWRSQLFAVPVKLPHIHRISYQRFCVWDFRTHGLKKMTKHWRNILNEKITDSSHPHKKKELWKKKKTDNVEIEGPLPLPPITIISAFRKRKKNRKDATKIPIFKQGEWWNKQPCLAHSRYQILLVSLCQQWNTFLG